MFQCLPGLGEHFPRRSKLAARHLRESHTGKHVVIALRTFRPIELLLHAFLVMIEERRFEENAVSIDAVAVASRRKFASPSGILEPAKRQVGGGKICVAHVMIGL